MIVQAGGILTDQTTVNWYPTWSASRSLRLYESYYRTYAQLYTQQPNVRVCVDFLARNIAQLGLHVFRRVSDTDRERLTDHPLAQTLERPLPAEMKVTRYRLIEQLMGDLGVYFAAFWLKIQREGGPLGLLRIPPPYVEVKGGLVPTRYDVTIGGKPHQFRPDQIVHFRGYNAEDPVNGLPPMETLRRILAEEHAAGDYREHFWANAARMEGVIERPAEAPEWSNTARQRFKSEFEALYSGGDNSGKTAILEEGMTWKPGTFNAQESEYLAGRKLTREECARSYHIPLPMVGILDNATYSNVREQHKHLYQDCLGPWLAMIEQEIELQLLPEFEDTEGVYCEFNIAEKLSGSFDEQISALQSAVGRPWMAADEARARLNLPSMGGDAARLVVPLNVLIGGQASPQDSAPEKVLGEVLLKALAAAVGIGGKAEEEGREEGAHTQVRPNGSAPTEGAPTEGAPTEGAPTGKGEGELDPTQPALRERHQEQWTRLMVRTFERQRAAVMPKLPPAQAGVSRETLAKQEAPDLAVLWDDERWNRELGADLFRLSAMTATEFAQYVALQTGFDLQDEEMLPWLEETSRIAAENINTVTRGQIEEGLADTTQPAREAIGRVFELAIGVRAAEIALSQVTSYANFGAYTGARQGGYQRKTWIVHSSNPRPTHARQNGMTVGIRDTFPNGLRWPGDSRGPVEETANCSCSVRFGR